MRARRLARAARFRAGLARHDAAVAHAPAAFFRFLGDVVAFIHVSLLRDVGPVLVILTVVVVAYLGRSLGGGTGGRLPNIGSIINNCYRFAPTKHEYSDFIAALCSEPRSFAISR